MAHAVAETTLIGYNGLNLEVLEKNNIKVYEKEEDLVELHYRNLSGDAGEGIVEEIPVILVCETSYYGGSIHQTEALATTVNNEFKVS